MLDTVLRVLYAMLPIIFNMAYKVGSVITFLTQV